MRDLRRIHLYLGCFFGPMVMFFALSGAWQLFELHDDDKGGYMAPKPLKALSQIHEHQRLPLGSGERPDSSIPLRWFLLAMSLGLITTAALGVVLAFGHIRERWKVWSCLAAGVGVPIVLLVLGGGV